MKHDTINRRQAITAVAGAAIAGAAAPAVAFSADPVVRLGNDFEDAESRMFAAWSAREDAESRLWRDSPLRIERLMNCGGCFTTSEEEAKQYGRPTEADLIALEQRQVDYANARKATGMEPFDAACDAAEAAYSQVRQQIAETQATTPAGLLVKARLVAIDLCDGEDTCSEEIAASLVADLGALAAVAANHLAGSVAA